jgi:hypothetical protein
VPNIFINSKIKSTEIATFEQVKDMILDKLLEENILG